VRHVRIDPSEGPGDERAPKTERIYVQERMSRPAVTVAACAPLGEALRLMAGHRIHYLPVIDDEAHLVGMVNEDDVLGTRRVGSPPGGAVAAVMSAPAVSVGPLVPLQEAQRLMVDRRIGVLPVVQDGRVIGILTQSDVVAALTRQHRAELLAEGG
jgi:acetoin utilization protein AcuB